jgi:hypothetical protein
MTKDWEKFKTHFKEAERDIWIQETAGTAGNHGAAHAATSDIHAVNAALLATAQAALAASEIALAQAMSNASLSSSSSCASNHSTVSATTRLSVIMTPDIGHPSPRLLMDPWTQ